MIPVIWAGLMVAPAAAIDDLSLNVAPGSEQVTPGSAVTVTLNLANLSAQINGVQVLLNYDITLMTLVDVVPTDLVAAGLITAPAEGYVEVYLTDAVGDVDWAAIINGGGTMTDHTVATLTFVGVAEGTTSVSFRPDSSPFLTKLTVAEDNSTILPSTFDSQPIVITCEDGVFCNGVEMFVGGICQPGTDPCDDGVGCTDDSCDEINDTCTNSPNDANCNDLLFCNGVETCDAVSDCQPGSDPCDDGVGCTDDTCDEISDSCTNAANDATCSDLQFCNGVETCDPALDCQPGSDPCDDGVACTDDTCDEIANICTNVVNDANCSDLVFCNGVETCDPVLDCQPGGDQCDDGVGCTNDSCDEINDVCINAPTDALCDDSLFCNGAETCDPVFDCQPGSDPCFPLLCDEVGNVCVAPLKVTNLEVFYSGRFGTCVGGSNDGSFCSSDSGCPGGGFCDVSRPMADPSRSFLAVGATATIDNITNYIRGITGIRVFFNDVVNLPVPPEAAFAFEWSKPPVCVGGANDGLPCNPENPNDQCMLQGGVCEVFFVPVTDAATAITVTPTVEVGATVVSIVLTDDHVRRRWLKVTIDSTLVTAGVVELDGELFGNPVALPSGDGIPGGNAVFFMGNITGDVDGNRKTELIDPGLIRFCTCFNPFLPAPITEVHDVDKDGRVLLGGDVGQARAAVIPFFTLPLISP